MKNILFILLAIVFAVPSCKYKTTKNAMKHGERLKASINDFEENRQKLSVKLVSSLKDAEKQLTAENPDLPEVSKDFEKQWTSIQKRYKSFRKDFERVGKTSKDYFAKLDELVNNINKESLRNTELAKNDQLRKKWDKSYLKAKVSIEKVTQVLEAGNDFHMVLVASSIRQKLEQNVSELNVIAEQAKALLGDLEAFTMAGRELVEG